MRTNALPLITPLRNQSLSRIDPTIAQERLDRIRGHPFFAQSVAAAMEALDSEFEASEHVEQSIYGGFPTRGDQKVMDAFHKASWPERYALLERFVDARYKELGERIIYTEAPEALPEGDLALFETGAIVFHIAERHAGLLPDDANARARAITWMFAALNTVEPPILERETARLLEGDKTWYEERMPLVEDRVRDRLDQLSGRLGDADWLDGAFSAGDLMMVSVLLRLKSSGILDEYPNLAAFVARGEARPAYKRTFDA
jgi:hypothetical protein